MLCVRGRELLHAYCDANHVAYNRCGKLIVAVSDADIVHLDAIAARARASGVTSLQRTSRADAVAMEPALSCVAALWSRDTGIVDSHGLMEAFRHDAVSGGAMVALQTAFRSAERTADGWRVTTQGHDAVTLEARWIVNCAGLRCAGGGARHRRIPCLASACAICSKKPLFCTGRCVAVLATGLSHADRWWAWHSPHARPRRTGALRTRCRMDC